MRGNVGDTLIEFATLALLRKWQIPHEVIDEDRLDSGKLPHHITQLFISGGGNMGDLYPHNQRIRELACSNNRPVIVLPQTFTNSNENTCRYEKVWVRESESIKLCPGAHLAPDMAMWLQLDARAGEARYSHGVFLREDAEGLFPDHHASYGDPVSLGSNIATYLEQIVPYRHIITDRLHFAIAAMLMSRRVTLLPNSYFKNRSMWETWLRDRGCFWADHIDQINEVRLRRVKKKLSRSESLQLTEKCQIKRAGEWRKATKSSIGGHNIEMWGRTSRMIWDALDSPRTRAELDAILGAKEGINRFNLDQKMNGVLRKLFSRGVIEITLENAKSPNSTRLVLGGDYGIPMEITVNGQVRIGQDLYLFADVRRKRKTVPIWFRIDCSSANCLIKAADTFILSVLHIAMRSGTPLWVRDASVTPELLSNLQQYQRVWSVWDKKTSEISIHANAGAAHRAPRTGRVITCFSGGVDSTFSLHNHTENDKNRYKLPLTDALLVHGFDIPIEDQASFDAVHRKCRRVTTSRGINLITMATNIRRLKMDWKRAHGAVSAGALHLISGPFTHGLIPSTLNYGILYPWGSTPLTDSMLSSATFKVNSDGADYTRVGKIRSMKNWETGIKELRFCSVAYPADHNCGVCDKCTMTAVMIRLANVHRDSIRPFPGNRRLALQLKRIKVSRLDKSDLRDETQTLDRLRSSLDWAQLLIEKLRQV